MSKHEILSVTKKIRTTRGDTKACMVVHACPSTYEAEAGRLPQVQGQAGLRKAVSNRSLHTHSKVRKILLNIHHKTASVGKHLWEQLNIHYYWYIYMKLKKRKRCTREAKSGN